MDNNLNELKINLDNIDKLLEDNENIIKNELKIINNKEKINNKHSKNELNKKFIFKTRKERKIKKEILNENIDTICKRKFYDNLWVDKTLNDWNENDYRIYVSNLGNEITENHLIYAFKKYKSFLKSKVIKDKKTGKNKGFGFVSFGNENDFISAMKEMNGKYIGKKPIKLKKSNWKKKSLIND